MYEGDATQSRRGTVLAGLGALAVAAVIVGIVVGAVISGVARVGGVGQATGGPTAPASLYMPPYTQTPLAAEETEPAAPAPQVTAVPLDPTDGPSNLQVGEITLFANPMSVSDGERIDLNGVYPDGDGVSLQVQRQDGAAWVDFPTTASVRSGGFDTFVYTGRSGVNIFRVYDPTTGRSSNPVSVTVGG